MHCPILISYYHVRLWLFNLALQPLRVYDCIMQYIAVSHADNRPPNITGPEIIYVEVGVPVSESYTAEDEDRVDVFILKVVTKRLLNPLPTSGYHHLP